MNNPTQNSKNCSSGWSIGIVVLLIIVLIFIFGAVWGTCTDSGRSTFSNIKNKFANLPGVGNVSLKQMDIVMFMSPTCPWCKKMIGVLESAGQLNNVMVVDISKPEGAAMAQQFGADKQPVPSFISRTNKVGTVGYRNSIQKLIDALKPPAGGGGGGAGGEQSSSEEPMNVGVELIKSLQIILFAREGCGWCKKAKENLVQNGLTDVVQVVDITTPEGQALAGQMLPPGTSGVPVFVSVVTKKHVVGYKPIDEIVATLKGERGEGGGERGERGVPVNVMS